MKIKEFDEMFDNVSFKITTDNDFDMEMEEEKEKEIEAARRGEDYELEESFSFGRAVHISEEVNIDDNEDITTGSIEDHMYIGSNDYDSEFDMMSDDQLEIEAEDAEEAAYEYEFDNDDIGECIDSVK